MARFITCVGCSLKKRCEKLSAMKNGIKGMGISSLRHSCKERDPEFKPGDPILVTTMADGEPYGGDDYYSESSIIKGEFRGWFVQECKKQTYVISYIENKTVMEGRDLCCDNSGYEF